MNDFQFILNIDNRLDKLNNNFKKYFEITSKGFFVFLLTYAFKNLDKISPFLDNKFTDGAQFRSETDTGYNKYIFILIDKYLKIQGKKIEEIFNGSITYKEIFSELIKYANAAGLYLINNDLNMYKNNITEINSYNFIYDVLLIIQELNEEDIF